MNHLAPTDAEFEQYEGFAASPPMEGYAMDASTLQGLAAALAIGPRAISSAIWLPWVWDRHRGRRAPAFATMVEADAVMALVMRQYNAVVSAFESPDATALEPLFRRSAQWGAAEFCQGFLIGVKLAVDDWAPLAEAHPGWMASFHALAQGDPEHQMALGDGRLTALVHDVEPDLLRIHDFWRSGEPELPTLRAQQVWDQVRDALEFFRKPFPYDAIALAHARRETVAPHLLRVLEDLAGDPTAARDGSYMLHLFAMSLLACWRDVRAYRPLLALASLDPELIDDLFGDAVHSIYGRAVASVCDGDLHPVRALIDDSTVSVWMRFSLLDAWKVRVMEGDAEAEPFERFLLDLGQRGAERLRRGEREPERAEILDDVASQACDIGSTLLLEPVRQWYAEGLIDSQCIDLPFFEREIALPHESRLSLLRSHRQSYIDDVAAEIAWWTSYTEPAPRAAVPLPATTTVRRGPKIGRNDPCPCGSGRKYKKCHGAN